MAEENSEMDFNNPANTDIYQDRKKYERRRLHLIFIAVLLATSIIFYLIRELLILKQLSNNYLLKLNVCELKNPNSNSPNPPLTQPVNSFSDPSTQPVNWEKQKKELEKNNKQLSQKVQELQRSNDAIAKQKKDCEQYRSNTVNLNMKYAKTSEISIEPKHLVAQIEQKRRNQNLFKTMINTTYIKFVEGDHYFDAKLYELLTQYYAKKNPKTIVDFGCGKCEYITKLHVEKGYDTKGYDGYPYNNNTLISKLDLSQPVDLGMKFDYVQSFEVGEHVYSAFENTFIANIAAHAKFGIVMSWAVIGQEGYMHVNNRNNDYVIERMEKQGFAFNKEETKWFRENIVNHFSRTLMVFTKK